MFRKTRKLQGGHKAPPLRSSGITPLSGQAKTPPHSNVAAVRLLPPIPLLLLAVWMMVSAMVVVTMVYVHDHLRLRRDRGCDAEDEDESKH